MVSCFWKFGLSVDEESERRLFLNLFLIFFLDIYHIKSELVSYVISILPSNNGGQNFESI